MELDALLCNHAEAVNNLLYIAGAGIDAATVPPNAPAPYGVNLGLGMLVMVPWTATNQSHNLVVELHREDGQAVDVPTGPDTQSPFQVALTFNVGRPPGLTAGDDQHVALAVNLPALPLPALGKYVFQISVDGAPLKKLPFRVAWQPGGQFLTGPATPGPIGMPGSPR